jgi:PTS system mannose-specific IIB component
MLWVRIDNRLVHGQVVESWLPYSNSKLLVVANDTLAADELQQSIISLAVPSTIKLVFTEVNSTFKALKKWQNQLSMLNTFLLFASCPDARRAFDKGLFFDFLNIGNIHYSPGSKQICDHVALTREDASSLRYLLEKGVQLDFRCIPNSPVQVKDF